MLRFIEIRKRRIRLGDRIYSREQLKQCKKVALQIMYKMNIPLDEIRWIKVRFATEYEMNGNFAVMDITNNEILVQRGFSFIILMEKISHEYGHKVTLFGCFKIIGKRCKNIIGEISADNFQRRFFKMFNYIKETEMYVKIDYVKTMKRSPVHAIAWALRFIPLGSLIKK